MNNDNRQMKMIIRIQRIINYLNTIYNFPKKIIKKIEVICQDSVYKAPEVFDQYYKIIYVNYMIENDNIFLKFNVKSKILEITNEEWSNKHEYN
tara:strand:- start:366 stop:647 length:282 start_codon:yes stop_codon:yes gene_type:complete